MFASMNLKQRLLAGFGAVALLLVVVSTIAIREEGSLNDQANFVAGPVLEGVRYSLEMQEIVLDLRRAVLNHAIGTPEIKSFEDNRIAELKAQFPVASKNYERGIFDPKERELLSRIDGNFDRLLALSAEIVEASRADDLDGVRGLLEGEHKQVRRALYDDLKALAKINEDAALKAAKDTDEAYEAGTRMLIGMSVIGVALAVALGLLVTRSVLRQLGGDPADAALAVRRIADGDLDVEVRCDRSQPSLLRDMAGMRDKLRAFADAQIEMQRQHEAGETDFRIDARAFTGAYARMAEGVNDIAASHLGVQQQLVALVDEYAVGDLRRDMPALPGKKAAITAAMQTTKRNLASINGDIQRMVRAASEGDFSARGDEQVYQHAFREMVAGLNRLMDTANTGLSDVGRVLKALAEGDLTQKITAHYQGAFGELAANTNQTVSSISEIVRQISEAVETINTAASEIATGNADLSTRTESQAASLEETASSMEELTATVRQNAENTRQAEKVAEDATQGARRGGQVVADVVQTMDRITAASRKIGDIISVIDGIAFQTNILALNAAVEAARAGDQGRGFAVVASEVRSLAQRSAEAAKEIKGLIDTSTQTVNEGAHLVDQAGNEIRALVDSVSKVTEIMKEISAATEEQRAGIEQVNETVMHLDQSTQQNAALVEEATASARSLEDQAGGLSQAVGRFRLAGDALSLRTLNAATKSHRSAEPAHAARRPRSTTVPQPKKIAVAAGKVDNNWDEF